MFIKHYDRRKFGFHTVFAVSLKELAFIIVWLTLLPVSLVRPWIGVLVWVWLSLMTPHAMGYGTTNQLPVAQVVGVCMLVGYLITKDKKPIEFTREVMLMLTLLVWYAFTSTFAMIGPDAWDRWWSVAKRMLPGLLFIALIFGHKRVRWLIITIALSVGFFGVKGGIFTLATGGGSRVLPPEGNWDNNDLAVALVMVVPLFVALARTEANAWVRRGALVCAALCSLSAVFTYSRGGLVALTAVLAVLYLFSKRKILIACIAIPVAFVGQEYLPERIIERTSTIGDYKEDGSANQRFQAWSVAWNIAKERPITGGGFMLERLPSDQWLSYASFMLPDGNKARASHSIYFDLLGGQGFIGLGLFVVLMLCLLSRFTTMWRWGRRGTHPDGVWIAEYSKALGVALVGYLVGGAFLSQAYLEMQYMWIAISAILWREYVTRKQAVGAERGSASERAPAAIGGASAAPMARRDGGVAPARPSAR